MQIEGRGALYATLVPDLSNASPFFIDDWFEIPLGNDIAARRKRFIAECRPLIFVQAMNLPRVELIVTEFGYSLLVRIGETGDVVLRPNDGPKGAQANGS